MIKAAYTSKELSLELQKKGIDAHHVIAFEKGKSWYKKYTLDIVCRWLREVHNLFLSVGFGNDFKGNFLYMVDIYDLTNGAVDGIYRPIVEADDYLKTNPKTPEEAIEAAIWYCLENLI